MTAPVTASSPRFLRRSTAIVHPWPEDDKEDPITVPVYAIPKPDPEPYWWDDPAQAAITDHLITARRELGNAFHGALLFIGAPGSGKTEGVRQAVRRYSERHGVELTFTKMDCATITDPQKWFGRREVDASGTRFVPSNFVLACERGDVILLDDVSRLHATLHNSIYALLDGSNEVHISDLNLVVRRHPQTVFFGTANYTGSGVHRMDPAMRERFAFTLERPWPPAAEEQQILMSATGVDADGAHRLVVIAAKSRAMFEAGDIRSPISTRTLVSAAWLVASGMTERQALDITAVMLYDPESSGIAGQNSERATIRQMIQGQLGGS